MIRPSFTPALIAAALAGVFALAAAAPARASDPPTLCAPYRAKWARIQHSGDVAAMRAALAPSACPDLLREERAAIQAAAGQSVVRVRTAPPAEHSRYQPPHQGPGDQRLSTVEADARADAAYDRSDWATALYWYRIAAARGDAKAENIIAYCYLTGQGVPKDYGQALIWYRQAATQGYAEAQNGLGYLYQNGWAVPQDYARAMQWYVKAAAQNLGPAEWNIGRLYESGWGVPVDMGQARYWYERAAADGEQLAKTWLSDHPPVQLPPRQATGTNSTADADAKADAAYDRHDWTTALYWYRLAAAQGDAKAQNIIGYCYLTGQGVPKDYTQAMTWYQRAAAQGYAEAENGIGYLYQNGWDVPQDYVEAMVWYMKAAEQKLGPAEWNIGRLYESGWGVAADLGQARYWYQRAADDGEQLAKTWLQQHPS